jgi:hypothetical protein
VVEAESSLTIAPGTVVIFRGRMSLFVEGQFSAVGTAKKPITIYRGTLRVQQATGKLTYNEVDETYVTGPRLEYVDMRDSQLRFNQDLSHAAGAYITNSAIDEIQGGNFSFDSYGLYIRDSWVKRVGDWFFANQRAALVSARLRGSYFDSLWVTTRSPGDATTISQCQIGELEAVGWSSSFVLEHSNIQFMGATPTEAGAFWFHNNNFGSKNQSLLEVGSSDPGAANSFDATSNYWGAEATQQMKTLGADANIDAIYDARDVHPGDINDGARPKVSYENWLTSPVAAGPSWPLSKLQPEAVPEVPVSCPTNVPSPTTTLLGACAAPDEHTCVEYTGPAEQLASLQGFCDWRKGTWQTSCASNGAIGSCIWAYDDRKGVKAETLYYGGIDKTPSTLKAACESLLVGTWY